MGHNQRVKSLPLAVLGAGAVAAAVLFKLWLVFSGAVPLNSDEAILALMARHILEGQRPVFFYGQVYMGSLDAFLIAGAFSLFGERVWALRLVQVGLYGGTVATMIWLGKRALGSWRVGVLAAWLLALPAVNVSLYTTATLGNYGEALLLGNLILLTTLRIANIASENNIPNPALWLLWGFLAGVGLWAFGLTLVYSIPACAVLARALWARNRDAGIPHQTPSRAVGVPLMLASTGLLLGSIPWWAYALAAGLPQLLSELGGSAIAGVEGASFLGSLGLHTFNLAVLGSTVVLGLRPPWEVRWLAWPLLPLAVAFWLAVGGHIWQRWRATAERPGAGLLAGVMVALVAAFVLSPFGADPSGRYFLPLAIPLALFAAEWVLTPKAIPSWLAWSLALAVLAFQLAGTVESARRTPPGLTTQFDPVARIDHSYDQELVEFLHSQGEMAGYTNYWVSYPLAFHSQESLIYLPRLPYHQDFRYTDRDDRYPPYRETVARSGRPAYITTHHPALDAHLRAGFASLGVAWTEAEIGDYRVFYALSDRVTPEELGLGVTTP